MSRPAYPEAVGVLIAQLRRLPGIGPRSAERIALWLVQSGDARPSELSDALVRCSGSVSACPVCGFFAESGECVLCSDSSRGSEVLCVVERAADILSIERTGAHRGPYHALGGRISPLDHVGPEDLRIGALVERVRAIRPVEVLLALSADIEGEATSHYLADLLRPLEVRVTRIAQGLPAGGGLEHADSVTLTRALAGRTGW